MADTYHINVHEYGGYCDDCGHWMGRRITVLRDGELHKEFDGDDHLAGGVPELSDVLLELLRGEGLFVEVTETEDYD